MHSLENTALFVGIMANKMIMWVGRQIVIHREFKSKISHVSGCIVFRLFSYASLKMVIRSCMFKISQMLYIIAHNCYDL